MRHYEAQKLVPALKVPILSESMGAPDLSIATKGFYRNALTALNSPMHTVTVLILSIIYGYLFLTRFFIYISV